MSAQLEERAAQQRIFSLGNRAANRDWHEAGLPSVTCSCFAAAGAGKGGGSVAALRVSAVAGPWYTVSCHVALAHTGTRAQRRLSRGPDGASRKAGCVAKTSPREWRLCRYEAGVAYGADEYHGRIGSTQRPFLMLSGDTDPQTGPCSQKPACPCPCPCFVLFCDSVCASLALLMTIDPQQVNPGSHAVASLALF